VIVGAEEQKDKIMEIDATHTRRQRHKSVGVACLLCPINYSVEYPVDRLTCSCGAEYTIKW
jgi:hypothetical protein